MRPMTLASCGTGLSLTLAGCGTSTDCASYIGTSVAEMRQSGGSGCFELSHVVTVARSPSTSAPRIYVQDPSGGDFSAIRAKCSTTSSHSCSASTAVAVLGVVDGAAVTVRGYYHQGSASAFEELYIDDVIDEGTLLAAPGPRDISLDDMSRDVQAKAVWFQVVTTVISADAPLAMYDFSPAEFESTDPCPRWSGFGVIPVPTGGPNRGPAGCSTDSANPPGIRDPDPHEILVGREFFKEFFASTDCGCAAASKQHLLDVTSTVVGPIAGVLVPEIGRGSSRSYQVFHPLTRALFPISGG